MNAEEQVAADKQAAAEALAVQFTFGEDGRGEANFKTGPTTLEAFQDFIGRVQEAVHRQFAPHAGEVTAAVTVATPVAAPTPDETPPATPAAVAHAEATGVDLTQVEGTGVDGTITKPDVVAAAPDSPNG